MADVEVLVEVEGEPEPFPVRLPASVARRMKVRPGARLFLVDVDFGEFCLSPYDPEVRQQIGHARGFFRKYRKTFEDLAKS